MLAKVAKKRADGGSSFRSLIDYIQHEVNEETGEIVGRGVVWTSDSILDPATAAKEMKLVALMNSRCPDAAYHYILTWREGERPVYPDWTYAVRRTLKALGLEGHQAVAVSHADTGNFHVHVAVNRVHPETYRAHSPEWSHRSLDEALRYIEHELGWAEDHGLYRWDAKLRRPVKTEPELLEQWRLEREEGGRNATGKAASMEAFGDTESLESYCRGEPARAVREAVKDSEATWQDIHAALARFGLQIHAAEKGGYTVSTASQPNLRVGASKALRGIFSGKANRAEIERRFGAFEPPGPEIADVVRENIYKRGRPRRGENREIRAADRVALLTRYKAYKRSLPPPAMPTQESMKSRRDAVTVHFRSERAKVKASALTAPEKRAAYSVLAMQAAQAREALRLQVQAERTAAREAARPQAWREWVAELAATGDRAAMSALRGIAYADSRRRRQLEQEELSEEGNAIASVDKARQDPAPATGLLQGARWSVDRKTGAVLYELRNRSRLIDQGRRIRLDDRAAVSADAIKAAFLLARERYGPVLHINGDAAFRERAVVILATMHQPFGVTLADPQLEALRVRLTRGEDLSTRSVEVTPRRQAPSREPTQAHRSRSDGRKGSRSQ